MYGAIISYIQLHNSSYRQVVYRYKTPDDTLPTCTIWTAVVAWFYSHLSLVAIITWVKVFRINPEFRILRLTFHRKSAQNAELRRL